MKEKQKTQKPPQKIFACPHFRDCSKQESLLPSEEPACQSDLHVPQLSLCFSHQLFAHLGFQRRKCESSQISLHYFDTKVITNPVVSNAYYILVLTLRHPGCMISLQMEHSISMRLNLLSSSSTVSSFPASPHTRHTAVWGNTGCLHTSERSLGQDTEDTWNSITQCAFTVSSFQKGNKSGLIVQTAEGSSPAEQQRQEKLVTIRARRPDQAS